MRLYPRMPLHHARMLASAYDGLAPEDLRQRPSGLIQARFAPTGGNRVTETEVMAIRSELDRIADVAGFPHRSLPANQAFDRAASVFLGSMGFPAGEMLRAEVWAWIAVSLVPHLVQWRFGGEDCRTTSERFCGSLQRNAIGRLWFRAHVFDLGSATDGRWTLVNALPEDATVAILERTTVSSDHRLARALALRWRAQDWDPGVANEEVLRQAAKRVRMLAVVRQLEVISEADLVDCLDKIFAAAVESLRAS
jgi:hypothetical protein